MRFNFITLILLFQTFFCFAETHGLSHDLKYSLESYTRETDYTIGSVATQHLVVTVPLGYRLDQGSLPEKGVTEAIELRDVHWQFADIKNETIYSFDIDWQIFVASESVKSVPLRSLELVFTHEGKSFTVAVPTDSVLVSPLLPPKMDAKHVQPYADVLPKQINTMPLIAMLLTALLILVLTSTYIAWYFGWIRFSAEKSMPFRQAWRSITKLNSEPNAINQALKTTSHAFNEYAGYSVTRENLGQLLLEKTKLQPHAKEIEQLYQDIQHTFFAGVASQHTLETVRKLVKQLSKLELS